MTTQYQTEIDEEFYEKLDQLLETVATKSERIKPKVNTGAWRRIEAIHDRRALDRTLNEM